MQYNTIQYTMQCNTIQYYTTLHYITQYNTMQQNTTQYNTTLHYTTLGTLHDTMQSNAYNMCNKIHSQIHRQLMRSTKKGNT